MCFKLGCMLCYFKSGECVILVVGCGGRKHVNWLFEKRGSHVQWLFENEEDTYIFAEKGMCMLKEE